MKLAALQADFGRWLHAECPAAAARIGGGPGLEVYLNNYRSQLIAALESGFPQLHRWLGEAAFLAAAAQHIEAFPPRAWTLDAYGADLADTIASRFPDDPECAELARIEWDMAAAFTAPDMTALDPAALGQIDWDGARFRFIPSLTLRPVATNAAAIWHALATDLAPPAATALPVRAFVLVWRRDYHPCFRSLAREEAEAIRAMQHGSSFGALCAKLATAQGPERSAAIAGGWLGGWLRDGLIAAVQ